MTGFFKPEETTFDQLVMYKGISRSSFYRFMDLYEKDPMITKVPDGLGMAGDIDLSGRNFTHYPHDKLTVLGNLSLTSCLYLEKLPKYLYVTENLYLNDCPSLFSLPPTITVKGVLFCDAQLIEAIPNKDLPLYVNYKFKPDSLQQLYYKRLKEQK